MKGTVWSDVYCAALSYISLASACLPRINIYLSYVIDIMFDEEVAGEDRGA